MNKLKAILHNNVLKSVINKNYQYDYIVVDQFAKPFVYYNYLKESNSIVKGITFLTKGEDKCLSVACASVISRFIFIKEFDKICKELNINIPKGAGNLVDEVGVKIVKEHGFDKLKEIAKINFKNVSKIKEVIEKED